MWTATVCRASTARSWCHRPLHRAVFDSARGTGACRHHRCRRRRNLYDKHNPALVVSRAVWNLHKHKQWPSRAFYLNLSTGRHWSLRPMRMGTPVGMRIALYLITGLLSMAEVSPSNTLLPLNSLNLSFFLRIDPIS